MELLIWSRREFIFPFVCVAAFLWLSGWNASAARVSNASEEFFTNGRISVIRVEINSTNLARLHKDDRKNVLCTVKEGGQVYEDVAVHVKGAAGSKRDIDDRPALTLNFDKFFDHQKFHGIDKLSLNNSVQDPSYMTEIICGNLFLAARVPTARATHARVYLNGRDLGLYILKEGFDREFLKRNFKNAKGNLYDGGFLRDINEELQQNSSRTVKDVKPYSELKALVAAADEPDPLKRMERLRQVLDMERFISFIALEAMTWHWDGYMLKRNNYRVYHDPDRDKIVFIPHGMDQMFWEPSGPIFFSNADGLVARAILQTTEGRRLYRERIAELRRTVFTPEILTNQIARLHAQLRPVLASIDPNAARESDGQAQHLREAVLQRIAFIDRQLQLSTAKPLKFVDNIASLSGWKIPEQEGVVTAAMDKVTENGKQLLHIRAREGSESVGSWRTAALLPEGRYRFEGRVRTAGVVPLRDKKGEGAGLRISGTQQPRSNKAVGDTAWQKLEFDFTVAPGEDEVVLVCELRARKGQAWFETESLRLVRK